MKLRLIPILHGVLALCLAATVSWAQDNKPGPQKAAPASEAPQEPCYAAYGLRPAEKIKICSDTIQSGRLKGIPLALAYYHRATADSAIGDVQAATSDYKEALRIFTEVIRVSQASAPLLDRRLPIRASDLPLPNAKLLPRVMPSDAEVALNPRARSAVMRGLMRLPQGGSA